MYAHLLSALKSHASVYETTTPADAAIKLSSFVSPSAVLITTAGFAARKHHTLRSSVVEYAKTGGTVVICGMFGSMIRPPDFDAFFQSDWSLPWKMGDYHRTTFVLNPARSAKLQNKSTLPASYSMKAVHIKGAAPNAGVYITNQDSRIESRVFAPESANIPGQAPVVLTPFGKGYLGYIGDVNAEQEDTAVILAMCDLSS